MSSKPKYVMIEGRKVLKKFPKKEEEKSKPKGSRKAGFVKLEIAKGNLKKENSKIVSAKEAPPKKKIIKKKPAPLVGPRNLKKGFGIKRMPKKEEPKPKKKTAPKVKDGKKKVSTMTFKNIVDENPETFLYRAEENFENGSEYLNWDWITGISSKMEEFYKENSSKYANGELSETASKRMEKIEEKMNENLRPSLERNLKQEFKKWKELRKDERMTEQEAVKSFENYYF